MGTAAPVSTGRAPRSCSWPCSCCSPAAGASQPAGTQPSALGGWGFFLPLAAQGLGLSFSCPRTHPGDRELPPAVRAWVKRESAWPAAVRSRREWGGQCGALGWLGCRAPQPPLARTPRTPSPLAASRGVELVNASALFLLLLLNLVLIGRQDRLKRREVERRLRGVIDQIQGEARQGADLQRGQCWNEWCGLTQAFWGSEESMLDPAGVCGALGEAVSVFPPSSDALRDGKEVKWPDAMYPDLHMPFAPSWSLHWAYRDGHLVNLPVSLLVEGDIIALRPGQESFASLRGIKVAGGSSPSLEILWERPPAVVGGSQGLILTLAAQLTGFLACAIGKMEKSWDIFLFIMFFLPCDP